MKKLKTWWFLLMAGSVLIVAGIYSLVAPLATYTRLAKYSGYILLLNGLLLAVVSALDSSCKKEKKWISLEGIVDLSFAVILLFNPIFTFIAYPFIIGYWILLLGVLKILAALALIRQLKGWGFILATGVLATVFGWLIVNLPLEKADNITTLIGLFGLTMGALAIFDAWRFRKISDTLNLLF